MHSLIVIALAGLLAGTAVAAGETITAVAAGESIQVNSSFNGQILVANESEPQIQEQERGLKQSMYERASRECELLRASIALSCRITSIGLSTQFNRSHGQPPTFYFNANVSMEVTLK